MSETTTDLETPPPEAPETPTEAAPETQATEQPAEDIEAPETPEEPPAKPNRGDRRFANLTARAAALEAERDAERRRADAAEALLRAGKEPDEPPTRQQPTETVEQAAERIVAQRDFNRKLGEIDASGAKEFGAEQWLAAKAELTALGATGNQAFLEALAETEAPAKVFAALAEDTDTLVALLRKPPVAMAAEMGRMAAKLETAPKPAAKPLSAAPRPPAPVTTPSVAPEVNFRTAKSMEEFASVWRKTMPKRMGGTR